MLPGSPSSTEGEDGSLGSSVGESAGGSFNSGPNFTFSTENFLGSLDSLFPEPLLAFSFPVSFSSLAATGVLTPSSDISTRADRNVMSMQYSRHN